MPAFQIPMMLTAYTSAYMYIPMDNAHMAPWVVMVVVLCTMVVVVRVVRVVRAEPVVRVVLLRVMVVWELLVVPGLVVVPVNLSRYLLQLRHDEHFCGGDFLCSRSSFSFSLILRENVSWNILDTCSHSPISRAIL